MPLRDKTVIIKTDGSAVKKKKEEEKKIIPSSAKMQYVNSQFNNPTPSGAFSPAPTTPTQPYRSPVPSPTVTVQTADGARGYSGSSYPQISRPSAGGVAKVTEGVTNRSASSAGNYGNSYTPRSYAAVNKDHTEDELRLTVAAMNAMSPAERNKNMSAFLRQSEEERRARELQQQKAAEFEKRKKDEETVRSKLYDSFVKNPNAMKIDGFKPETINYFYNRASKDISEGKVSPQVLRYITNNAKSNLDKQSGLVYNKSDSSVSTNGAEATPNTFWNNVGDFFTDLGENVVSTATRVYEDGLQRRAQEMIANPNLDTISNWLSLGLVENTVGSLTSRSQAMIEDPNLYTVSNWLSLGAIDTVKGAINPEEPLSLQHWLDSLGTVAMTFAVADVTKGVVENIKNQTPPPIGVPFNPNGPTIQEGVDPHTLIPMKDLSTLDPQRLKDVELYGSNKSIIVYRNGIVQDGHHRLANAIANNRAVDVERLPY